jgi:hypothetical protein
VSTPVANAAPNVAVNTTQTAAVVEGVLNIATANSTTGAANADATGVLAGSVPNLLRSVGLVNVSDVAGGLVAGTTQTAVLLSTGTLVVYTGAVTASMGNLITVENGTLTAASTGTTNMAVNSSRTGVSAYADGGATDDLAAAITPNAGATSMVVRLYNKASATSSSDHVNSSNPGTLMGLINVTIASASTAGAIATSKSGVYYTVDYDTSDALTADEAAGLGSASAATLQYASIRVRDAYGTAVAAGGLLQASATNGARVALDATSGVAGTASTAFSSATSDATALTVSNPTNAPLATTVTVTYNGTVI